MTAHRDGVEQGFALVFVLWMVALIAILAISLVHETSMQAKMARNQYEHARARALADTGISLAIIEMLDRAAAAPLRLDGSEQNLAYDGGTIRLRLQDEAGKIDLNSAPDAVLSRFFQILTNRDEDSVDLGAAIAAWKQRRLAQWAGPDGSAANTTNGPFLAVEELLEVNGMTPEIYNRVAPFLTVLSRSARVDPLSAPREVLLSLPGSDPGQVDAYVAARQQLGPNPALLPRLSGLEPFLIHQATPEFVSISSAAKISSAVRFIREATISLTAMEGQRFHFVRWEQGKAE